MILDKGSTSKDLWRKGDVCQNIDGLKDDATKGKKKL